MQSAALSIIQQWGTMLSATLSKYSKEGATCMRWKLIFTRLVYYSNEVNNV